MKEVILTIGGEQKKFGPLHAQNILNIQVDEHIPDKDCMKLPENSKWEFKDRILKLKKS